MEGFINFEKLRKIIFNFSLFTVWRTTPSFFFLLLAVARMKSYFAKYDSCTFYTRQIADAWDCCRFLTYMFSKMLHCSQILKPNRWKMWDCWNFVQPHFYKMLDCLPFWKTNIQKAWDCCICLKTHVAKVLDCWLILSRPHQISLDCLIFRKSLLHKTLHCSLFLKHRHRKDKDSCTLLQHAYFKISDSPIYFQCWEGTHMQTVQHFLIYVKCCYVLTPPPVVPPELDILGPPGTSCGLLRPPGTFWMLMAPP